MRRWLWLAAAAGGCSAGLAGQGTQTARPVAPVTARDSLFRTLSQVVANGSIIADAQLGRNPPMAVGACLDPVAAARVELDRSLALVPDQPPVLIGSLDVPGLPESMRDAEVRTGVVLARWVVDTSGAVLPASVMIASSPHGLMSVQVCGAVFSARFTPARDDGRVVPARVEMAVRFVR